MTVAQTTLQTTLVFLQKDGQILLGKKQRGHGKGKWNGAGGKCKPHEWPEAAARREAREELGVAAMHLEPVAVLYFTQQPTIDEYSSITTYVYLCREWEGEPVNSDELSDLTWFDITAIPYETMWEDDTYWLPQVLAGDKVTGKFEFDGDYRMTSHDVTINGADQPTLDIPARVEEILSEE